MPRLLPTLFLTLLFCAGCGPSPHPRFNGTLLEPPIETGYLQFETARGAIDINDFTGQFVVLVFGYTFCPDACPTTMARLARAMDALGEDARQVQVILVTVDPQRDSPARLHTYVNNFNPDFIGAVPADAPALFDTLGIYVERADSVNTEDYAVDHTTTTLLLDRAGQWRLVWNFEITPEEMAQDLQTLLASS